MSDGEQPNKRILIPKNTLEPGQNNIIEIPESCEDSRVLIARLQQRFDKPPGYYPPTTNPENKFERRIGDTVVGLGMPPLSPVREERHNYQPSLSQYGSPQSVSYEPSYFGTDTTHGSQSISGKFDYCPASTPVTNRSNPPEFPSPKLSPIRMGRDIFAPDPSVYPATYTPTRTPPPRPASPDRGLSCSIDEVSGYGETPSPRRASPSRRSRSPARAPTPGSDGSCSFGDLSDMMSFDAARGPRAPMACTPDSIRGMTQIYRDASHPATPIPEELHNATMNCSMAQLDNIDVEELKTVQERMRNFQVARRELVLSILALPEAEVSMDF